MVLWRHFAVSSDVDFLGINTSLPRTNSERMVARVRVLELIDRRRRETGDEEIGAAIERLILAMCLAEIEDATARDQLAATPRMLSPESPGESTP